MISRLQASHYRGAAAVRLDPVHRSYAESPCSSDRRIGSRYIAALAGGEMGSFHKRDVYAVHARSCGVQRWRVASDRLDAAVWTAILARISGADGRIGRRYR